MADSRVVVVNGELRIVVEGSETFVKGQLEQLFPWVSGTEKSQHRANSDKEDGTAGTAPESVRRQTIQSFFKDKRPANAYEAIALAIHYKRTFEEKTEFDVSEIRTALRQAAFRPPDDMPQALTDCRRRYGYVQVGTKKGLWTLTHQGETLVEVDLPRQNS
jgi:hypothetical protein